MERDWRMNEPGSTEEAVTEIIADVLGADPADVPADTALAALGWDSMNSMEALVRLEKQFSVSLDLRSFHAAYTIVDMAALIEKNRAGHQSRA
ncbi:acyl carrier protein [Streptomyces sp. NPDC058374]|uniref:acyl carrier protein n=1 Tax=Streptomyces sp. NPDC058374 TaxID=3346466 RepID=UPI00365F7CA9